MTLDANTWQSITAVLENHLCLCCLFVDIHILKVTHAFRMFKARDLDEQGIDDDVSVTSILQATCIAGASS